MKLFVANKTCGNGHKENLIEAYDLYMKSEELTWNKPFYQRYDKKRKAPNDAVQIVLIAQEKHVPLRSGIDHLCPLRTEGQRSQRPTQE